jgi:hypothetical protein
LFQAAEASRPLEATHGVLSEGDTKSGNALGLAERSKHQPFFRNYMKNLAGLDRVDLSHQMNDRYQNLDAFLDQIRRRIQP